MNKQELLGFIRENKLSAEDYNLDELLEDFIFEMNAGLSGKSSSLLMLPSYVNVKNRIKADKKVAVIDAGGTNFRTGLVHYNENGVGKLESYHKCSMPGSNGEITKNEFFEFIVATIKPYLNETDRIIISFAYPVNIFSIDNGQILKLVKELKVKDIEGCFINYEIEQVLKRNGYSNIKTYITNDTIATAMSGLPESIMEGYDSCIGVIAGTGTNICYPEKNINIRKLELKNSNRMMINVEAGNFNKIPRGAIDINFDNSTIDPGYHQLEKMVGGGYLGKLAGLVIRKAAETGLLSTALPLDYEIKTSDVSGFLENNSTSRINLIMNNNENKNITNILLSAMVKRAAYLIALEIAAASVKSTGKNSGVLAIVEGTMFYKMPGIKKLVTELLNTWLYDKYGIKIDIKEVSNAVLIGSAAIALTI